MDWGRRIVEFDRKPLDSDVLCGFVLQFSAELTLLALIDEERFELNGYSVIRNRDVRRWRPVGPDSLCNRVLRLKAIKPVCKRGLSLANWAELLQTAGRRFPLITIRRERIKRNACHIGRVGGFTKASFELEEIDPDGVWRERNRYRFRDITLVAFGGGYEDGLVRVAAEDAAIARKKSPRT